MSIYSGCTEPIGAFNVDDCVRHNGQIRGVYFLKKDIYDTLSTSDLENATTLAAYLSSGSGSSDAYLLAKVRGEYAEPENSMGEGFGDDSETLIDRKHTVTMNHNVVKENRDFWNAMSKSGGQYVMGFRVDDNDDDAMMYWTISPVVVMAAAPVGAAKTDQVTFNASITWNNIDLPLILDNPTALWNE